MTVPTFLSAPRRRGSLTTLLLASLVLSGLVSGCTVGPDFQTPNEPRMARYASPDEPAVPEIATGPGVTQQTLAVGERVAADWWQLLRSPPLDSLVKEAIAGNRTLESAQARLTAAQEALIAAESGLAPRLTFEASATRGKFTAASFGLGASSFPLPPNYNVYQVGPTASYALDVFGGTRRRIEQQAALAELQQHQLGAATLSLTGNVVSQAVQMAALRAERKAIDDILTIDQQNLELVNKERRAGSVPDTHVVSAQSQLATDETLQPGLDQQLSVAHHALAVLVGRAPGEWAAPDFDLDALTLPERLPLSLPSDLVHQRPDILAAEAQLHAASARIGVATAALYPSITLSGTLNGAALDPAHLFDPASLLWNIAAGLSQPVFDGGLREADRRAALAEFKAAAADYQQTVLQAFGQIADLLQALVHDSRLLAAQRRALDLASDSVRLQQISYSGGGSGILDLLDAQRQYQQARLGYVRAEAQRYQDSIQLLVAMGGGWWHGETPAGSFLAGS